MTFKQSKVKKINLFLLASNKAQATKKEVVMKFGPMMKIYL
jgi:hypothetical protein